MTDRLLRFDDWISPVPPVEREVVSRLVEGDEEPPLLFVSGPRHGAWTFAERWRGFGPSSEQSDGAEVAVSPCARAGGVYVLADGRRARTIHAGARELLGSLEGIDLAALCIKHR